MQLIYIEADIPVFFCRHKQKMGVWYIVVSCNQTSGIHDGGTFSVRIRAEDKFRVLKGLLWEYVLLFAYSVPLSAASERRILEHGDIKYRDRVTKFIQKKYLHQ